MSFDFNTHSIGKIEQGSGSITPSGTKTITENGTYNVTTYATASVNVQGGTEPTLVSLTVTPSTTTQTITPASGTDGYDTILVNNVTSSIDANIQASNIKSGVSILGVSGNVTALAGETTTITTNGTYTPSVGNGFTSVEVNVSGGGGSSFESVYEVVDGKLQRKTTPFTFTLASGSATSAKTNVLDYPAWQNYFANSGITAVDFSCLNLAISQNQYFKQFCYQCSGLKSANFKNITGVSGSNVFQKAFEETGIETVDFSELTSVTGGSVFANTFASTSSLLSVTFPKLSSITGASAFSYAFSNSGIQNLYFPALNSSSFGSNTNQFSSMINNTNGCTIHFPSGLQSTISGLSGASSNFGGRNAEIVYDL